MEYTDGNCKYKIEKIGVALKNKPMQIRCNKSWSLCEGAMHGTDIT